MSQYCPRCKWYSADGLTHCSTCGAPFEAEREDADEEEEEPETRPLVERIGWILALAAGLLVVGSFLYRRYGTAEAVGTIVAPIGRAAAAIKDFARSAYQWLIGPAGEYKDFVAIALAGTLFVWLALWVLARIGKR